MKIDVVGVGAMGSVYAALLSEADHEIWAIDILKDHLDSIREKGLRIEGFSGNRTVKGIRVAKSPEDAGQCDLVIIATKAVNVLAAGTSVAPMLDVDTLV